MIKTLSDYSSSFSIRLVKLTGKHRELIHPKHLINERLWFRGYLDKADHMLDLGSGVGQNAIEISNHVKSVIGLEIDYKSIKIASKNAKSLGKKNIKFIHGDANKKLPFKSKTFDKILASDVLEHLNKRNIALLEIRRVLKKRGLLFLVTDNPATTWKKLQKSVGLPYYADKDHKYEYSREEIINLLKINRFKILSISTVTYDTPLKGFIDLTGGFSITIYKKLRKWRKNMNNKYPQETTGFRIVAKNL